MKYLLFDKSERGKCHTTRAHYYSGQ